MRDSDPLGMLRHALKTRQKKQGPQHVDVGFCLIKAAEGCWATDDFEGVIERYSAGEPSPKLHVADGRREEGERDGKGGRRQEEGGEEGGIQRLPQNWIL